MRFAFVYDETGSTHPTGDTPPPPEQEEQRSDRPPHPAVRIAAAAEQARTRGATDFHRTLACLDRMWHTISVSDFASPNTSGQAIDWASDEVDQDEMFRPQAFRAPTEGSRP